MSDFYVMQRGWKNNPIFADEPYTEREAFEYLIEHAAWKPRIYRVGAKAYKLKRGQLTASLRFLADAWKWNKNKVDRFLSILADGDMIGTENGTGQTVITICNYCKYQDKTSKSGTKLGQETGQSWDNLGTMLGQPWDKTNQVNQYNQVNHYIDAQEVEYQFLEWKDIYPKKGSEKQAREEFKEALSRVSFDELLKATKDYAAVMVHEQQTYIKAPHNWLKYDCWKEELPERELQPLQILYKLREGQANES